MASFGTRIEQLRLEKLGPDSARNDLAKALSAYYPREMAKLTDKTVGAWETGASPPRWNTGVLLARYFGVSLSYLNGDTDERGEPPKSDEDAGSVPAGASSEDAEEVAEAVTARKASRRPKPKPRRSTRRPES